MSALFDATKWARLSSNSVRGRTVAGIAAFVAKLCFNFNTNGNNDIERTLCFSSNRSIRS
jgi:hypothetical protein